VFTARCALNLYIERIRFVLKGLNTLSDSSVVTIHCYLTLIFLNTDKKGWHHDDIGNLFKRSKEILSPQ